MLEMYVYDAENEKYIFDCDFEGFLKDIGVDGEHIKNMQNKILQRGNGNSWLLPYLC